MTSDLPTPLSSSSPSPADPSSSGIALLKASLTSTSSSSSSTPSCLYHSRQWRPSLEFCLNSLRTQGALKHANFSLKALTCTCCSSSSSSPPFPLPPSSFNPASAIASLDSRLAPLRPSLTRLLQLSKESEQAKNFIFLVHSLADPLSDQSPLKGSFCSPPPSPSFDLCSSFSLLPSSPPCPVPLFSPSISFFFSPSLSFSPLCLPAFSLSPSPSFSPSTLAFLPLFPSPSFSLSLSLSLSLSSSSFFSQPPPSSPPPPPPPPPPSATKIRPEGQEREEKEKEREERQEKKEEPPLLSKTIQIPLEESFVGVFITKKGFASLLAPLQQRIHVHCGTWAAGNLPITISAVSMETIETVAQALQTQALMVTLARKRHLESLRQWAEETQKRQIKRKNRVMTPEQTENRFLTRRENAKSLVSFSNLKQIATSHYERSVAAANASKEISARQKRRMSPEERRLAHEVSRQQGLVCTLCSQGFRKEIASSPCSHHPGFVRDHSHWGRGKAARNVGQWSCCGQPAFQGPCVEGKHVWAFKASAKKEKKEKEKGGRLQNRRIKVSHEIAF